MNNNESEPTRQSKKIFLSGIFSEGFGVVPKLLMKADDLSLTTKAVLCYLLSYTGSGTESWPSHTEIINNLHISQRTLHRSINEAIEHGYISRKRKFARGIGSRNIYSMIFMEQFRPATRARSKNKKLPSCHLDRPPEQSPYNNKQENKHSFGNSEKKSKHELMERIR